MWKVQTKCTQSASAGGLNSINIIIPRSASTAAWVPTVTSMKVVEFEIEE